MNASPNNRLQQLFDAACTDSLEERDARELDAILAESPQVRQQYVEYCQLHCDLYFMLASQRSFEAAMANMCAEPEPSGEALMGTGEQVSGGDSAELESNSRTWGHFVTSARGAFSLANRPSAIAMSVAALVIGLLITAMAFMAPPFYHIILHGGESDNPSPRLAIAQITNLDQVVWANGSIAAHRGAELSLGDRLHLNSGVVELWYRCGAQVVIQGPCSVRIDGANSLALPQGTLLARVAEAASGFTVQTPHASVTDLGTEFGVHVVPDSFSDVQVYSGSVNCAPQTNALAPQVLLAGQALRISDGRVESLASHASSKISALLTCLRSSEGFLIDFDREQSAMILVGDAQYIVDSALDERQRLRLTDNHLGRVGCAWYIAKQRVADGFSTTADFQISFPTELPADGLALVIQNTEQGRRLYVDEDGPESHGLSISFDVFQNEDEPAPPFLAVTSQRKIIASVELEPFLSGGKLSDGKPHSVRVDYREGRLSIWLDQALVLSDLEIDLRNLPGGPAVDEEGKAWVGFTARTGGEAENHDVLRWRMATIPNLAGRSQKSNTNAEPDPSGN